MSASTTQMSWVMLLSGWPWSNSNRRVQILGWPWHLASNNLRQQQPLHIACEVLVPVGICWVTILCHTRIHNTLRTWSGKLPAQRQFPPHCWQRSLDTFLSNQMHSNIPNQAIQIGHKCDQHQYCESHRYQLAQKNWDQLHRVVILVVLPLHPVGLPQRLLACHFQSAKNKATACCFEANMVDLHQNPVQTTLPQISSFPNAFGK